MLRLGWNGWLRESFPWTRGGGAILGLLLILAALGLVNDAWHTARGIWQELHRPIAVYRRGISQGLAISLNDLESKQAMGGRLPGLDLRGVLLDRSRNDWVLLGEATAERSGLPLDAVAIALRAIRLHLEAPGIDIQPRHDAGHEGQAMQQVEYFGGTSGTVVGRWFFKFDYWMKRATLGLEPIPIAGMPVYWQRAVEALDREVEACDMTGPAEWARHNRYWLCAGEFSAIEGNNTLMFERTPLLVLAERYTERGQTADGAASPCASRGADDPLATEFANWLTEHLAALVDVVPVSEIEDFARLLAGLTWLAEQDPYRDLSPWLNVPLTPAETPTTVPSLTNKALREHQVLQGGSVFLHQHRLELSGGVLVVPSLACSRVGDDSLLLLHRAVLTARPPGKPAVWRFTFRPSSI